MTSDGANMLTVAVPAAVSGVAADTASPFNGGDAVTLIDAAGGLAGTPAKQKTITCGTGGALLQ